jgi:hypothetical protein
VSHDSSVGAAFQERTVTQTIAVALQKIEGVTALGWQLGQCAETKLKTNARRIHEAVVRNAEGVQNDCSDRLMKFN